MTPEERACQLYDLYYQSDVGLSLIDLIATAIREARNEALEEAAKVAAARDLSIMSSTVVDVEARLIASRIRALKEDTQ